MKELRQPCYIVSVYRKDASEEDNTHCHAGVRRFLRARQVPFKELEGMYKGELEYSFLIPATYANVVKQVGIFYEQESILYLDESRYAYFIAPQHVTDGPDVTPNDRAGRLDAVDESKLGDYDGYSYDPVQNLYYTVK